MKIFYFMGRNPLNRSGVSWKVWKIERKARTVTVWYGPVVLKNRKPVPAHRRLTEVSPKTFRSVAEAKAHEEKMIDSKEAKGYQRRTRWL